MTGAGATTGGATAGGAATGGATTGATSGAEAGGAREATIARRDAASDSRTPRASKRLRCCLSWARLIRDRTAKAGCPS
ncbi:hypothetical protein GUJ93_ZPchr0004g38124 [Zizania palustris]|uniref:Uncharacterized protein n=1 Tax=Zizania palustris TaxID=103762 RepID=A0A8J5VZ80_ZIZPA|nr:hypothetical protein GUJ93_ZPchr0004g38124 [Zizania palustris]